MLSYQLFIFILISTVSSENIPPTEEYPHQADLDAMGHVILYWKFNETHITFEVSTYFCKLVIAVIAKHA